MSNLTRCNRCTLKALAKWGRVTIVPKFEELGGYDLSIIYPDAPEPVWAAWVMGLPNVCTCDE